MREHKFDETEVVCIVFGSVIRNFVFAVKSGDENLLVCAYVNGEVLPTGFIPSIVYFRLVNNGNGILLIEYSVVIGIVPVKNTDPTVFVFIRDIYPEADGLRIFNDNTLVEEEV